MEQGTLLVDEQFLPAAVKLIGSAQRSISISTFKAEITTRPRGRKLYNLFDVLFDRARAGVDVRFLINRVTRKGSVPISNLYAINTIPKHGIAVRTLPHDRCCHAKLIIVDSSAAILGSHNLSVKSCHNNFEVSYMHRDGYMVHIIQRVFDTVWSAGFVV